MSVLVSLGFLFYSSFGHVFLSGQKVKVEDRDAAHRLVAHKILYTFLADWALNARKLPNVFISRPEVYFRRNIVAFRHPTTVCAVGASLLITHDHSPKEEIYAINNTSIVCYSRYLAHGRGNSIGLSFQVLSKSVVGWSIELSTRGASEFFFVLCTPCVARA